MCFYNDDYDWTVDIEVERGHRSDRDMRCDECDRPIRRGQWCREIEQYEHEYCQLCQVGDADPDQCEHDYGEEYHYVACVDCSLLLMAIEIVERQAGCPSYAVRPDLGCLEHQAFTELDELDIDQYRLVATELYPRLANHPFFVHAT